MVQYCANHPKIPGLLAIDVTHNIGAVANSFVAALRTLQKSPGEDIAHLFTRRKNCPTPNVSWKCLSIDYPDLRTISRRICCRVEG